MSSNPNDYCFSQETGLTQFPTNPVRDSVILSTILQSYKSDSQESNEMSVEADTSNKIDVSFNEREIVEYFDPNDDWDPNDGSNVGKELLLIYLIII